MTRESTDVHVHCHAEGSPAFVGLHGWNGSHRTFEPLRAHLPVGVGLYAPDLPGYGRSAPPPYWTLTSVGEAVAHALRRVGLERYRLVGNCSGAAVALAVAECADARIPDQYLLEPFVRVPWYLRLLLTPWVGRLFYDLSFGSSIGRRLANALLAGRRTGETDLMASFSDRRLEVPYRYLELFASLGDPRRFRDLPGRKHLVHAGRTFREVRRSVACWSEVWPDARRHLFPDAGHLLLEEATAEVASLLVRTVSAFERIPSPTHATVDDPAPPGGVETRMSSDEQTARTSS